jgi:hypothetical protein
LRCLNCGAIHDDVIHMNQLVPPSVKRVRSPVAGLAFASGRVTSMALAHAHLNHMKNRS